VGAALGEGNKAHMGVKLTREQKLLRDKAKGKSPSAKKRGGKKGDQKERHGTTPLSHGLDMISRECSLIQGYNINS